MKKTEHKKGSLEHPELQQPTNYSGMVYSVVNKNGTIVEITPTDIDGLIEMERRLAIFKEYKYNGIPLKPAQAISFPNLCDGLCSGFYEEAITLHIGHYDGDAEQIDCGEGIVLNTYIGSINDWSDRFNGLTASEVVRTILQESKYKVLTDKEILEREIKKQKAKLAEFQDMLNNLSK